MVIKDPYEALADNWRHITEVTDPVQLRKFREDNVQIDSEGYWTISPRGNTDIEICLEPVLDEDTFLLRIYKNRVEICNPVLVKLIKPE